MANEKVDKNKEKLQKFVHSEITSLFEKVLDYSEVAVPNAAQYGKLRSKILRVGNNCIREINKEIDSSYDVVYKSSGETIIEFKTNKA